MANKLDTLERFYAPDRAAWRNWLLENHGKKDGVWLIYFKKESGRPRVSYEEAVEEALCFGWIDSKPNKIDDISYMQLFSPRKASSNWSKLNKDRVERLGAQGLMMPAGQKMVDLAKANGKWNILDGVEALEIPGDLQAALDANPGAKQYFEGFSRSSKRGILEWILNAKRPETREKRITETVERAAIGKRANFPADND